MADRIVWNHEAIEQAEDSFADEALAIAKSMRGELAGKGDGYVAKLRRGKRGGRRYASLGTNGPKASANERRTNALLKAGGSHGRH